MSKSATVALSEALEDLSKQNFDKFCHRLLNRREEPRVRTNRVEGKNFLEIADVLVSTFTERRAVEVAAEILSEIELNQEAQALREYDHCALRDHRDAM